MEWQDIASAPKDGTRVLIWSLIYGGRITIARWDDDRYAAKPRPRFISAEHYGRRDFIGFPPTHWLPLPTPPETTA